MPSASGCVSFKGGLGRTISTPPWRDSASCRSHPDHTHSVCRSTGLPTCLADLRRAGPRASLVAICPLISPVAGAAAVAIPLAWLPRPVPSRIGADHGHAFTIRLVSSLPPSGWPSPFGGFGLKQRFTQGYQFSTPASRSMIVQGKVAAFASPGVTRLDSLRNRRAPSGDDVECATATG